MTTFKLPSFGHAALVAALIGIAVAPASATEIVFGHGAAPGNPRTDAATMFADILTQQSHGKYTVNIAGAETLGNDVEMLKSVKTGVLQITANSQGPFAQIIPEVGALGLPFLFDSLPAAWQVLDGPIGAELNKLAEAKGYVILAWWDNGIREVTHVSKFVKTPADIAGMKIRTPADKVTLDMFKALGANPAPLAFSELPTALRAGTFDGQENPLTNIYSSKLHEVSPFISMTGHKYESTPVVAGLTWWKGLSAADQKMIQDAAVEAGWYQRGRSLIDAVQLVDKLKKEGGKFATVDKAAFKKGTASVYELWQKDIGDFVARLEKAAAEANKM